MRTNHKNSKVTPYREGAFNLVYSVGCLHHTGHLERGVSEIYRVLKPKGNAIVMVYDSNSYRRRIKIPIKCVLNVFKRIFVGAKGREFSVFTRALYDVNTDGQEPPYTDFVSKKRLESLFTRF